ncbi:hypothetical protein HYFRA_00005721 [Hymenoscyphus fraxineus]|uniref:Uncharacterized protein n=1 Tax=Hymenoscyphus fraxineus TaxID=746836 RepID=A0A9N9KRR6_9HELO|nr:hypothetical protein HYFRA_00005721 [Hymenoscyphus fraxineus]
MPSTSSGCDDVVANSLMIEPSEIKPRLMRQLEISTKTPNIFAVNATLNESPNPGLHITGFGMIGFPLSEHDIERIKIAAVPNPQNERSPGVWEVPARLWQTENPKWDSFIKSARFQLTTRLGVDKEDMIWVNAKKASLILCLPGGVMQSAQGVENNHGMFGTLDITLPSSNSPCESVLTHDGRKRSFDTGQVSAYDCFASAFFQDVVLTSSVFECGYRLVLRYSLVTELPGKLFPTTSLDRQTAQVQSILSNWAKQPEQFNHKLLICLESSISEATTRRLKEACQAAGFYLCKATLKQKIMTFDCEDDPSYSDRVGGYLVSSHKNHGERQEKTTEMCNYRTFEGHALPKPSDYCFDEGDIIQSGDQFTKNDIIEDDDKNSDDDEGSEDEESEDEDSEDEDSEDEGEHEVERYSKSVLMIIPRKRRITFFYAFKSYSWLQSCCSPSSAVIALLQEFCEAAQSGTTTRYEIGPEEAHQLCEMILSAPKREPVPQEWVPTYFWMMKAIALLDNKDLISQALPAMIARPEVSEPVFSVMALYEKDWLYSTMESQLSKITKFEQRYTAVRSMESLAKDDAWIEAQYKIALSTLDIVCSKDGARLAELANNRANEEFFRECLLPAWRRNMKFVSMTVAFLDNIGRNPIETNPNRQEILSEFLQAAKSNPVVLRKHGSDHKAIASIFRYSYAIGLMEGLQSLAANLTAGASYPEKFDSLRLLQELAVQFQEGPILRCHAIQDLFRRILCSYISQNSPKRPSIENLTLGRCGCGCHHCNLLDQFLLSPTRKVFESAVGPHVRGKLRAHLKSQVQMSTKGSRGTWQITKTDEKNITRMKEWEMNIRSFKNKISSNIGLATLRIVLGSSYDMIMSLKVVSPPKQCSPAKFIDLTSEPDSPNTNLTTNGLEPNAFGSDADLGAAKRKFFAALGIDSSTSPNPGSSAAAHDFQPAKRMRIETHSSINSFNDPLPPMLTGNHLQDAAPSSANRLPSVPPPQPPKWLIDGLDVLKTAYPADRFEAIMRHSAVDRDTRMPLPTVPPGSEVPDNMEFMYLPRIRCQDCPGKLYTPGPEESVENFEVHLKNRQHRERVDARIFSAKR